MTPIRLVLISSHRVHLEALTRSLQEQQGFVVAGTGRTGEDALLRVREHRPDVALLDLPRGDGLPTLRALAASGAEVPVIALGLPNDAREILAWAEAGAAGFVVADGSFEELRLAVEAAARGELHCSPAIAAAFVKRLHTLSLQRSSGPQLAALTAREREIVGLIDLGYSNKEIATRLGIEVATVKNHVHNLLEKLNVSRRAEAAARVAGRLRRMSGAEASPPRR